MIVVAVIVTAIVIGAAALLLPPIVKLERQRRADRNHKPEPHEIWLQGNQTMLYIAGVGPNGVQLMAIDVQTREVTNWTDTWDDWQQRLRTYVVLFTGQRRPLQNGFNQRS